MFRAQEAAFQLLEESFHDGSVCLVLGAGASVDIGLPQWKGLVEKVAGQLGAETKNLDSAGYARVLGQLARSSEFWRALSTALYSGQCSRDWVSRSLSGSYALKRLAILAILGAIGHPDRSFHAMTYNLDCLLEEQIAHLGHRAVASTANEEEVWEPTDSTEALVTCCPRHSRGEVATVRIFHPHGLLLREGSRAIDPILTAEQYESLANVPLGQINLTQMRLFIQRTCIFYGFSMTDPNVNRLQRLVHNLVRSGTEQESAGNDCFSHIALITDESGSVVAKRAARGDANTIAGLEQIDLYEMGVLRLGHMGYRQHRLFLAELLRRVGKGFQWPGKLSPYS